MNMNPVIHFEMPYRDAARANKFYSEVFGWKVVAYPIGGDMGDYLMVTTAEKNDTIDDINKDLPRGVIQGGLFQHMEGWPMQHPSVCIAVKDIKEHIQKITKAGGKVHGEVMKIEGVGDYAVFEDTEGNVNSILQPGDCKDCGCDHC